MAYKVSRKKQFGIKLESVNGTAETLTTSNYGLQLSEISAANNIEMYDNNVFKGSIDQSASRTGKGNAVVTIGGEFKNSGTLNTAPKVGTLLESARYLKSTVYGYAFSVASGTSTRGADIITGGTSGATGRFVKIEGSKIYLADISGTFTVGETVTDSVGTWTATLGAKDGTATGFYYRGDSSASSEKCATIHVNEDGILKPLYGAMCNFGLDVTTDGFAKFVGSITGVMNKTNWGTAVAMIDESTITWESTEPPVVVNASLTIGSYSPIAVSRVNIDTGNTVTLIEDLNSDSWYRHADVVSRGVAGTIELLTVSPSDHSFYADFIAGTTAALNFTIGSGAGKQIEVILPYIQYTGLVDADKEGFLSTALTFKGTGTDNAIGIWFR